MSDTYPLVVTTQGFQPTPPATLLAQLQAIATTLSPGITFNLPASLIEDISSTDTGGLVVIDSARVELGNSLTPYGANAFLLNQLGQIYGVPLGSPSYTSVYVIFNGPPGFVISQGFTVSDGTYQYTVQNGGAILSSGYTNQLFCLATSPGIWSVPTNTVTQLATSLPAGISLTVTNPVAGTPGTGAETQEDYQAVVLQAGLAASQGMARFLKTILKKVTGVQSNLISVLQQSGGGWEVICGGGDPYAIAYAIYTALFDISTLVGSVLKVTGITNANPGVVTTNLNHLFTTGQVVNISGIVGMTELNNTPLTITVLSENTFSVGVNTSGYTPYISGGVVTPNLRNISVSLYDYPNTYVIPFVNPPIQTVTMAVTWNTTSNNFISNDGISQLAGPAIVSYIETLAVGQPINLNVLGTIFQTAIASILQPQLLSVLNWSVSINGVSTNPSAGTETIFGDPESGWTATTAGIVIAQA